MEGGRGERRGEENKGENEVRGREGEECGREGERESPSLEIIIVM